MKYNYLDNKYKNLILNIKDYFSSSEETIHSARNIIKVIEFKNKKLAVKSFGVPNLLKKLVYTFFATSKSQKSYDFSVKLLNLNINVANPIGYIEFYKYGLLNESYFVSENINYDFTIREPLRDKKFQDRDLIIEQFVKFTYYLHQKGVYHLDYSAGNILVQKSTEGDYSFYIVDINRMKFFSQNINIEYRMKNFNMLWLYDDDAKSIAEIYSEISNLNRDDCVNKVLYYSHKQKKFKNKKKKIKSLVGKK